MDNVTQRISLIFNNKNDKASSEIIDYMVSHALRTFIDYDDRAGKKYFATDFTGVVDLRNDPSPDVILFENIETEEDAEEARRLVKKAGRGARFFVPLGSSFLTEYNISGYQKIFTYSLDDPKANFYAYRLEDDRDGFMKVNVIYQPDLGGRRTLRERLFEAKDSSVAAKFRIPACDKEDAIKVVKAFAFGLSLSLEQKYIINAMADYGADETAPKEPAKVSQASPGSARRRQKEADFD